MEKFVEWVSYTLMGKQFSYMQVVNGEKVMAVFIGDIFVKNTRFFFAKLFFLCLTDKIVQYLFGITEAIFGRLRLVV